MPEILSCAQDPATGEVRPNPSSELGSKQEELSKPLEEDPMPSTEAASISVTQEQPTEELQMEGSRRESEQKVVAGFDR